MPRAPKSCNEIGCPNLVYDGGRYCEVHQKHWENKGFDKRRSDTAQHRAFKKMVLQRAEYRCEIGYVGVCTGIATEVDRKDNSGDYTEGNCQAACHECHVKKTSIEGHKARGHSV